MLMVSPDIIPVNPINNTVTPYRKHSVNPHPQTQNPTSQLSLLNNLHFLPIYSRHTPVACTHYQLTRTCTHYLLDSSPEDPMQRPDALEGSFVHEDFNDVPRARTAVGKRVRVVDGQTRVESFSMAHLAVYTS